MNEHASYSEMRDRSDQHGGLLMIRDGIFVEANAALAGTRRPAGGIKRALSYGGSEPAGPGSYASWAHCRVKAYALAALFFLLATAAFAQDSQFFFDPSGNLFAETSESSGLPQIIGQPQMQVVVPGESASFSVSVADTSGVSYQWYFNSTIIPGATGDSLLLTNVGTANQGPYFVAVSNSVGSVASVLANLYIDSRGCGMPDSWQLQYFGSLNQPATGDYDGDGVSNLQEFLDGTNPTNAASALYRITLLNDGGSVVISPDQPAYTNGQIVTLTATSTNSNPFHAWTGDVATRSNSITVTMNTNLSLFARFLPFTLVWTNTQNGDWNVASSWSPNLIPGDNESVLIDNQTTVTENSNVDLVDLTLGNSTTTAGLAGSGTVTIAGSGFWYNGTMSGGGATVVKAGASLFMPNSLNLGLNNRTLENTGVAVWVGGNFSLGGVITNDPGAQFQFTGPSSVNFGGGTARFDNAGTFIMASNAATAFAPGVAFDNYETVSMGAGATLTMSGGGIQAGSIIVPGGSAISFQGGIFTSTSNLSLTGLGELIVGPGTTATLAGIVNFAGSNIFSGGFVDFTGTYICTNNAMLISGGSASFDGTGAVSPAFVTLSINGTLGGAQNVTVLNAMNWTGGNMNGTGRTIIPPGVTLSISNASPIIMTSRTLDIAGTVIWNGTGSMSGSGAVITNEPGALFQIQGPLSASLGNSRFDNAGTLRITGSGTTSFSGSPLNNFNLVDIQGGTLALSGGGTHSGTMNVPAGTAISLGGAFTSTSGSFITGAGQLSVSGVTATLAGTVNVTGSNIFGPTGGVDFTGNYICTNNSMQILGGSASFDGTGVVSPAFLTLNVNGTLGGAQNVTIGTAMSWLGGNMSGTGRTIIPLGATLTTSNALPVIITSRTLDNGGTIVWTGAGTVSMTGTVITNRASGLFNVQNAVFWTASSSRFDNAGTFRKSVSPGTMTFDGVNFTNYGTVDIQSGVVASASGGYGSTSNAVLNCALGGTLPGTNYGQLQVAGSVNLNGTLSVNLTNNYTPATNASFTLLSISSGSRSGTFSKFIYPSSRVSMVLSNTATAVIAIVTNVITSVGQPILYLAKLSANSGLLYWSTNFPNYFLEYNTSPATTNWAAFTLTPVVVGTNFVVTNRLSSAQKYYRLSSVPASYIAPPPALSIQTVSSGAVRLLWPIDDDRPFTLQSTTNPLVTNWTVLLSSPATSGTNNVVTNTVTGTSRFYRLSNR